MGEPKPQIPFLFVGNQLCLDFINTKFVLERTAGGFVGPRSRIWSRMRLRQGDLLTEEEAMTLDRQWGRQAKGSRHLERGAGVSRHATGDGHAELPPAGPYRRLRSRPSTKCCATVSAIPN